MTAAWAHWLEALRAATRALSAHRGRSALTALSIALGACAVSLMVSVAQSGVDTIKSGVEAVGGRDVLLVVPRRADDAARTHYDRGLTDADADSLRAQLPPDATLSYLTALRHRALVADNGRRADVDVGIGPRYREVTFAGLAAGRDVDDEPRAVVLGHAVALQLFGSVDEALGRTVTLLGAHRRVSGVTTAGGHLGFELGGVEKARAVFLPLAALPAGDAPPQGILLVRAAHGADHAPYLRTLHAVLRARHRDAGDYEVKDFAALLATFDHVFLGLQLVALLIALVSLGIAGVGITSMLLAAVRQRSAEIGTRRALGATRADVQRQFLIEAMLLGLTGGAGGTLAGALGAGALGALLKLWVPVWQAHVSLIALAAAPCLAMGVGVLFGVLPARRAAQLDPVVCLRGG